MSPAYSFIVGKYVLSTANELNDDLGPYGDSLILSCLCRVLTDQSQCVLPYYVNLQLPKSILHDGVLSLRGATAPIGRGSCIVAQN